jgi:hypothetical protein
MRYFKSLLMYAALSLTPGCCYIVHAAVGYNTLGVSTKGDGFALSAGGNSAPLYVDANDYPGVIRAFKDLQTDIGKVTHVTPTLQTDKLPKSKTIVIAGTLGKSAVIEQLVKNGKINATGIRGKWETFQILVISKPLPGIKEALVIVGSDKRGTIFGIYELSAQIGVSPWYWWADVPVEYKENLYISRSGCQQGPPSVKYRGIFLNDEHPNLTLWVQDKFGTIKPSEHPPIPPDVTNYNSEFYTKIFELILRLKGNFLWPAMWNNAFNEDDSANPRLADEYGIVMGTSHQEPMLRAQKEWDRRYQKTLGSWNYSKHPEVLQQFWREGIARNKNYESIITMGLRGANDTPMALGGPEENMAMLKDIIQVQRKILGEEMNRKVTEIPQLWCLYKEVQEFYNAGMRVPDDVTLLWAEDNWGNLRRVPSADERKRSGGAGIYYHFDYHGGPRNYQWMNTSALPKIWDQLSFAKQYGADRIWIVNVGHFKGYSLPLSYFMDLAWDTDSLTNGNIREYTREWTIQQFGTDYADETTEILMQYPRFNSRRKPELLTPNTYSLVNYGEGEKVVADYNELAQKAEEIYRKLPSEKKDAYYELVLFPSKASALVNELYLAAGKNYLYARQGRASTNDYAALTQALFTRDTSLMGYFNNVFANGRWRHFMDQPHLGYRSWNHPPQNTLQHIALKSLALSEPAEMGVTMEETESVWPGAIDTASLPEFDIFNRQSRYVDIFNKGKLPFSFEISADPWISINEQSGTVEKDKRVWIGIDWEKVPDGKTSGIITVKGTGQAVTIMVSAFKPADPKPETLLGFVESNGCVSMEAAHFIRNTSAGVSKWIEIEEFGHTLSGMRATSDSGAAILTPGVNSPCLEYRLYLFTTGKMNVHMVVAPTLNFFYGRPLRYAVSFDNEPPQIVTLVSRDFNAHNGNREWEESVSNNYRIGNSIHDVATPGYHVLKVWMIDPSVVVQKIVVDTGGVKPSYLGPPESFYRF